jgi:hypothetical protein
MRVLERDASPAASYALKPGIAWYAGTQARDNSISDAPPAPYLCLPSADAVRRAWYAAAIGTMVAERHELIVLYFVDPETRYLYAQPHPDTAAASERDWGIAEPHAQLPFEPARDTARWIYKLSRVNAFAKGQGEAEAQGDADGEAQPQAKTHEQWWRSYVAAQEPNAPPFPLGLPVDPEAAYRDQGWINLKDWLVKPRTPGAFSEKPDHP